MKYGQGWIVLLLCGSWCSARLYEGGFERGGKCYCYELVEDDVPPAMVVTGVIREKLNQKEPAWKDAGASFE